MDKISLNCLTFSSSVVNNEDIRIVLSVVFHQGFFFVRTNVGSFCLARSTVPPSSSVYPVFGNGLHQLDKVANPLKWIGRSLFWEMLAWHSSERRKNMKSELICGTVRRVFRTDGRQSDCFCDLPGGRNLSYGNS